ncbi:MAG: ArnT family glycosyltransferase [Desulfobacteraceae bacterium]|jgi:4-amino-4-deoxy-L-arabinose transferase-like glycosyltransferase
MSVKFDSLDIWLWLSVVLLAGLYFAAVFFRPLLPIDETRYMAVAWEMFLRGDWFAPLTVNFNPYHHKPPLLFWLINMSWSLFGTSRWAGTVPVFISSLAFIFLSKRLAELLFPHDGRVGKSVPILIIGSLPFLVYSLVIMFDVTLAVFVLLTLMLLVLFAKSGEVKYVFLMGLSMGFGVLTKGPVAWLYVIFPIITVKLWTPVEVKTFKWYAGCTCAVLLSVIPVLIWLVPVLSHSSDEFAYWLVWEQTFGRINGSFKSSHARPLLFYIPFVFLFFIPWIFFPSFWKSMKKIRKYYAMEWGVRFLILWIAPVLVSFSLIKGKQPHYLVPVLPGFIVLAACLIKADVKKTAYTALFMFAVIFCGQWIASKDFLNKYDLKPIANFLQNYKDVEWAYLGKYEGELSFAGKFDKKIDDRQEFYTIDSWFGDNPGGIAIIRYRDIKDVEKYDMLFDMAYRGKRMGIFKPHKK